MEEEGKIILSIVLSIVGSVAEYFPINWGGDGEDDREYFVALPAVEAGDGCPDMYSFDTNIKEFVIGSGTLLLILLLEKVSLYLRFRILL